MASFNFPSNPNDLDSYSVTTGNVTYHYFYNDVKGVWQSKTAVAPEYSNLVIPTSTTLLPEGDNLYYSNSRTISTFSAGTSITLYSNGLIESSIATGGTVDSVNGEVGDVVLTTANIAESGNLYYTNARILTSLTSGYLINVEANGQINLGSLPSLGTYNVVGSNVNVTFSNSTNQLFISNNEIQIAKDFGIDIPGTITSDGSGSISTKRTIGNYSRRTSGLTSGVVYPVDLNWSNSVTSADTLVINRFPSYSSSSLINTNDTARFALKSNYGSLNAGLGFLPFNSIDSLRIATGGAIYYPDSMTTMFGFSAGNRCKITCSTTHLLSSTPPQGYKNVVGFFAGTTELNSSIAVNRPVIVTSNTYLISNSTIAHDIIFNVGEACTVTFTSAAEGAGIFSGAGLEYWVKNLTNYDVISSSNNIKPIDSSSATANILPAVAGSWARLIYDGTDYMITMQG